MNIEKQGNEFVFKVPDTADLEALERLVNYIEYCQLIKNIKATQEDVDKLSREVNIN
jgi:ligand-binding sensor protein